MPCSRLAAAITALLLALPALTGCAELWETPTPTPAATPDQPTVAAPARTATRVAPPAATATPLAVGVSAVLAFGDEPLQSWADPNDINGLLHDGRYLWATTAGGVVRWDPVSGDYTTYGPLDGLATQNTRGIARDADGHVWVAYADHGAWSEYDGAAWHTYPTRKEAVETRLAAMLGATQMDARLWSKGVAPGTDAPWLWLPAADGRVQAYDGKRWRTYGEKEGVTRNTWLVVVDTTSHVWALGDGISTAEQGDARWVDHSLLVGVEANSRVTDIVADGTGGVWLSFVGPGRLGGAVTRMEAGTERWTTHRYSLNAAIPRQVYGLQFDAEGALWVWGEEAITSHRPGQRWQRMELPKLQAQALVRDAQGRFWIGTDHGIWSAAPDEADLRGPMLVPAPPIGGRVDALAIYGSRVIIGTARGVSYVDALTGETGILMSQQPLVLAVVAASSAPQVSKLASPGPASPVPQVSTVASPGPASPVPQASTVAAPGPASPVPQVSKLAAPGPASPVPQVSKLANPGPAESPQVSKLAAQEKLAVGTRAGLYLLDGAGVPQLVTEDPVAVLAVDSAGVLWGATEDGKLGRLAADGWQGVAQAGDHLGAPVKDLAVAADGTVWLATPVGLVMRSPEGEYQRFGIDDEFPDADIRALALVPDGPLWVGTARGLMRRNNSGSWSRLTVESTEGGLQSEEIWDLWVDGERNVWFATGAGVSQRSADAKWAHYDVTGIRALRPGPGGTVWLGGLNGLYRLRGDALAPAP